ncbi:hypothetical protein [Brevundimonas sp. G8]|uniref:hypothetical protein n=1 Tax=Brevundimonas sp. G8 TaxID=1350776 RepID=UPI0012F2AA1C|nr:hypothetical protein [Brevundimonas sp. G8]VXB99717.1 hypothetical protein BREVUG8_70217 [Brevundimonas sp. G8]
MATRLKDGKYNCSGHYDRGFTTCTNGKIIAAATVERRVLAGVKAHLISPAAIALAVSRYQEAAEEHQRMIDRERAPMEKELIEIGRRLERAQVMFMEEIIDLDTLKARTAPLETRRRELSALLSDDVSAAPARLDPGIAEAYRRLAENLHLAIEGDRRGPAPRVAQTDRAGGHRPDERSGQVRSTSARQLGRQSGLTRCPWVCAPGASKRLPRVDLGC